MLICQVDNGADNSGKKPTGGMLSSGVASSMSVTVANPITIYANPVINQSGHSSDLYNYYFASYSRGADGQQNNNLWHNLYLDSYIPLRHKSIYDPCPYGYRIPSNGTYNQFTSTRNWIRDSYVGCLLYNNSIFPATGGKNQSGSNFGYVGSDGYYSIAITSDNYYNYGVQFYSLTSSVVMYSNRTGFVKSQGISVRCIEECELLPDATISKLGVNNWSLTKVPKIFNY